MIIRIFRVQIRPELREEFEAKFSSISVEAVETKMGFAEVTIGKPTKWAPDEYAMITKWENEDALRRFAGPNCHKAVIPEGMGKFLDSCWVHHYEEW